MGEYVPNCEHGFRFDRCARCNGNENGANIEHRACRNCGAAYTNRVAHFCDPIATPTAPALVEAAKDVVRESCTSLVTTWRFCAMNAERIAKDFKHEPEKAQYYMTECARWNLKADSLIEALGVIGTALTHATQHGAELVGMSAQGYTVQAESIDPESRPLWELTPEGFCDAMELANECGGTVHIEYLSAAVLALFDRPETE